MTTPDQKEETFLFNEVPVKVAKTGGMHNVGALLSALREYDGADALVAAYEKQGITLPMADVICNRVARAARNNRSLKSLFECVQTARAMLSHKDDAGPGRPEIDGMEVEDGPQGGFPATAPRPEHVRSASGGDDGDFFGD